MSMQMRCIDLSFHYVPFVNSYPGSNKPRTSHTMHIPLNLERFVAQINAQPSYYSTSMGPQCVFISMNPQLITTFSINPI